MSGINKRIIDKSKTPSPVRLFGSINLPPMIIREAFVVTKENIIELATNEDELEIKFGDLWGVGTSDYISATRLLESYTKSWGLFHHNRAEVKGLIKLIGEEKALSDVVVEAAQDLYQSTLNKHGDTALLLKYLLLHCSGHYTEDVRIEVKNKIVAELSERLATMAAIY
ncbi:MAG TPA: hypothetical protein VD770_05140 [Coxiellaceae bacterium]|nr:hypothetical protein [Coxiellaceae bacterium]